MVDTVSMPRAKLGNIIQSRASIQKILAYPRLLAYYPNTLYNGLRVVSFSFNYVSRNEPSLPIYIQGDRLSQEIQAVIRGLHSNDRLQFEDIRMSCPDCSIRALEPFTIIIE